MQMLVRIILPENNLFLCRVTGEHAIKPADKCLVMFDYGVDAAIILEVFRKENEPTPNFNVIRKLTPEDTQQINDNQALANKAQTAFALSTQSEKTKIKILTTRFSFARDKLFIRYSAETPVDLRRFIGQIQRDFKTHVDLWQVGARDETALMGCLGPCGRAVCCCTWQHQFRPVNVRMLKAQEMLLNPILMNGSCGKLKCCLGFEYDQYREAGANIPEVGSLVSCSEFENVEGVIIGRDIMRGNLTVRTNEQRYLNVRADQVKVLKFCRECNHAKETNDEDSIIERS